tara:strand:- start:1050 stop:3404 length:2355 start_codon:yes stop_codon:yes gene_type:complete
MGVFAAEISDKKNLSLEEVIVTAQRKVESLQDTPISIAALTAEDLEKQGINNIYDLKARVPNLTVDFHPVNNQSVRLFIRGTGTIDPQQITQDAPIGVYLDGVYIARSTGMAFDVAELARIEVLRGPQGTLYGRNSTGGTLNLITARPNPAESSFKAKVSAGNYNMLSGKFSWNQPLSDNAAIKLAYLGSEQDGFIENTGEGGDFGDRESEGFRIDLSWDISDALRLDYGYDQSSVTSINYSMQAVRPPHDAPVSSNPAETFQNQIGQQAQRYYDYTIEDKKLDKLATSVPVSPSSNDILGHSLTLSWMLNEQQFKYIGGYREMEDRTRGILSAGSESPEYRLDYEAYTSKDGSLHLDAQAQPLDHSQFSHEFQWLGSALNERLNYIVGLYYFEEDGEEIHPLHHILNGPVSIVDTPLTTTITSILMAEDSRFTVHNEAWASFAQLDYTLPIFDDRFSVIFGARHSEDSRAVNRYRNLQVYLETETVDKLLGVSIALPPLFVGPASDEFQIDAKKEFSDDSFTFVLSGRISDDINTYIKFAEAYKSGGFNTREPDPVRFAEGFDEEKVESLEIGIKSELLGRRLRLNANYFDSEFSNRQMNFKLAGAITDTRVLNAGVSQMRGIEVDGMFLATHSLMITASFAMLDTKMLSVINPDTGEDQTDEYTFFSAPEVTWNVGFDYNVADFSWGQLRATMNYNYTDSVNMDNRVDLVPDAMMDGYGIANGRVGLYDINAFDGSIDIGLWAKNIADKEYVISTIPVFPHASRGVYWGPARTVGIDISYEY